MKIYIEALVLYIVIFFSGSASLIFGGSGGLGEAAGFSWLAGIFLYGIPSLALIWFVLLRVKSVKDWNILPGKKDLFSCLIALPSLLIIGFFSAFLSSNAGETSAQVFLSFPSSGAEWALLCFFCIIAAYVEESFFRFYLLSRKSELKLGTAPAVALSAALFSICHLYEGYWGVLNAALSGTVLAVIFLRFKSLHGISIAHAIYNIAVYAINSSGH